MSPGQVTVIGVARMVAAAWGVLRDSREAGLKKEGVIAVLVAARLDGARHAPDVRDVRARRDAHQLEQMVRVELEKMGTADWERN